MDVLLTGTPELGLLPDFQGIYRNPSQLKGAYIFQGEISKFRTYNV